jgi:O-antigen ligase/Tfp pilus assembly protein PilF
MSRNAYRIFIFVLIFSPLAFGAVEQWSSAVMECLSMAALIILMAKATLDRQLILYRVPGILPLTLLGAYMFLSLVPLPPAVLKLVSPGTLELYQGTVDVVEPGAWRPITVFVKSTLLEFFRFAGYAFFYVLAVQLLTDGARLRKVVVAVIVFAAILSFSSILQHFLSYDRLLWLRRVPEGGIPFGPYVNKNHYAGFMGMVFPVAVSIFLAYRPRVRYRSLRQKIADILGQGRTNAHLLLGFAAILIATSVFISLSRGGIIGLCLSMAFMGLVLGIRDWKNMAVISVVFVVIVTSVGWFGWGDVFSRFGEIWNAEGEVKVHRIAVWKDSAGLVRDFPVTGTGFGTFVDVYPRYRSDAGELTVDHAHNDYVELLTDGGVIGFVLAAWFVISVLYSTLKALKRRMEPYCIYLCAGSIAGMLFMLIHSLAEFNFHIGANGLYFFFLSALAVSSSNTRFRGGSARTYLERMKIPYMKSVTAALAIMLAACLLINAGGVAGTWQFSFVKDSFLGSDTSEEELAVINERSSKAARLDPIESKYRYAVANAEMLMGKTESALDNYAKAIGLRPLRGEYLQRLGLVYSYAGDNGRAERLLRAGVEREPLNFNMYRQYVSWLFSRGEIERGLEYVRKGLVGEPNKTREYVTLMLAYRLGENEMLGALPDKIVAYLMFGDYLFKTGRATMGRRVYLKGLRLFNASEIKSPYYFFRFYGHYLKRGMFDEALGIMQDAIKFFPEDVRVRYHAGVSYQRLGITYRAKEEYRKALVLEPDNKTVRERLERLKSRTGG